MKQLGLLIQRRWCCSELQSISHKNSLHPETDCHN